MYVGAYSKRHRRSENTANTRECSLRIGGSITQLLGLVILYVVLPGSYSILRHFGMQKISSYLYDYTETELKATETCCIMSNCRERAIVLQRGDRESSRYSELRDLPFAVHAGKGNILYEHSLPVPWALIKTVEFVFCRRVTAS